MSGQILITGASGQLGRSVLHHLLHTYQVPGNRIIATSRSPQSLNGLLDLGVEVRKADFDDMSSLDTAFAGAERMLIISTDHIDRPGERLSQHQNAVAAAEQNGVRHLVYTSIPDPGNSPLLVAPDHEGTEAVIAMSAIPAWTVLRNCLYFETVYRIASSALTSGRWPTAAGNGRVACIARDDVAKATAAALAKPQPGKTTLTLTGPQAYTYREIADLLSRTTGRPVSVHDVSIQVLISGLIANGHTTALARISASIETAIGVGILSRVTDDYQKLTGSVPTCIDTWLQQSVARIGVPAA